MRPDVQRTGVANIISTTAKCNFFARIYLSILLVMRCPNGYHDNGANDLYPPQRSYGYCLAILHQC
jgi:hypothetical protein